MNEEQQPATGTPIKYFCNPIDYISHKRKNYIVLSYKMAVVNAFCKSNPYKYNSPLKTFSSFRE
jgi:hypothetical protein